MTEYVRLAFLRHVTRAGVLEINPCSFGARRRRALHAHSYSRRRGKYNPAEIEIGAKTIANHGKDRSPRARGAAGKIERADNIRNGIRATVNNEPRPEIDTILLRITLRIENVMFARLVVGHVAVRTILKPLPACSVSWSRRGFDVHDASGLRARMKSCKAQNLIDLVCNGRSGRIRIHWQGATIHGKHRRAVADREIKRHIGDVSSIRRVQNNWNRRQTVFHRLAADVRNAGDNPGLRINCKILRQSRRAIGDQSRVRKKGADNLIRKMLLDDRLGRAVAEEFADRQPGL